MKIDNDWAKTILEAEQSRRFSEKESRMQLSNEEPKIKKRGKKMIKNILENNQNLFQNAMVVFGTENQILKALEEISELSCEFAYNPTGLNIFAIEEVGDAIIMLYQILNFCELFEDKYVIVEQAQKQHNSSKILNLSAKVSRSLLWYLTKGKKINSSCIERLFDELLAIADNEKTIDIMEMKIKRLEEKIKNHICNIDRDEK